MSSIIMPQSSTLDPTTGVVTNSYNFYSTSLQAFLAVCSDVTEIVSVRKSIPGNNSSKNVNLDCIEVIRDRQNNLVYVALSTLSDLEYDIEIVER